MRGVTGEGWRTRRSREEGLGTLEHPGASRAAAAASCSLRALREAGDRRGSGVRREGSLLRDLASPGTDRQTHFRLRPSP